MSSDNVVDADQDPIHVKGAPPDWHRAALVLLEVVERSVTELRHRASGSADRLQLKLLAWRASVDPETHRWADEARRSAESGDAKSRAWSRADILRMMEERRSPTQ